MAEMSSRTFQKMIRTSLSSNEDLIAAAPLPKCARNAATLVRPVVEPTTILSRLPSSQHFAGAVVNRLTIVRQIGPGANSAGPLMSATPSPDLLQLIPGGLCLFAMSGFLESGVCRQPVGNSRKLKSTVSAIDA